MHYTADEDIWHHAELRQKTLAGVQCNLIMSYIIDNGDLDSWRGNIADRTSHFVVLTNEYHHRDHEDLGNGLRQ